MQNSLESDLLEITYQKSCQNVADVYANERERRFRVQKILLEHDHEDLEVKLRQSEERVEDLTLHGKELQASIDTLTQDLEAAQGDIRVRSREIETVKAELESLQSVTMDSTRLLTEKLALSRELSSLRPEVNHLRSQLATYHSLLAEKLSLERHISTLQVELENERRSSKRTAAKDQKQQEEAAESEAQLERLQADLNKERKQRQKAELETLKVSSESESRTGALESKVDAFRAKLKTTKDLLTETQLDLQNTRSQLYRASPDDSVSRRNGPGRARKREAARVDEDTMIGTPGDSPRPKRGRKASSMVGEKSTFSITPFLNRTASAAPESEPSPRPCGTKGRETFEGPGDSMNRASAEDLMAEHASDRDTAANNPKGPLGFAEDVKRSHLRPQPSKSRKAAPRLEQVLEEENHVNGGAGALVGQTSDEAANDTTIGGCQATKTRRKLVGGGLGKTLFDDESSDVQTDRGHLGGVKGFGRVSRGRTVGSKLASRMSTFGTISPLKRDRRLGVV